MARAPGQRWTARLLAAVASFALAVASLLGSAAHACESGHHGQHRHQAQVGNQGAHHHEAAKAHSEGSSDAVARPHGTASVAAVSSQSEPSGSDRKHTCCMDFICHGCIAIIAGETASHVAPRNEARVLPWDARALASMNPARLDRPPKSLVSA
jgi:hypothetical protein